MKVNHLPEIHRREERKKRVDLIWYFLVWVTSYQLVYCVWEQWLVLVGGRWARGIQSNERISLWFIHWLINVMWLRFPPPLICSNNYVWYYGRMCVCMCVFRGLWGMFLLSSNSELLAVQPMFSVFSEFSWQSLIEHQVHNWYIWGQGNALLFPVYLSMHLCTWWYAIDDYWLDFLDMYEFLILIQIFLGHFLCLLNNTLMCYRGKILDFCKRTHI